MSEPLEYLDRDNKPIDASRWRQLIESNDYRQVARTERGGKIVSTVWLGIAGVRIDDEHAYQHPIFETVVLEDHDCTEVAQERTRTEEDARCCHQAMVTRWLPRADGRPRGTLPRWRWGKLPGEKP